MRIKWALLVVAGLLALGAGLADDAAPVTPTETIELFNGENLDGWKLFLPDANADPANTWSVADGKIVCAGQPVGYMRTTTQYRDYRLHVEWRWSGNPGNCGVLLHVNGEDRVWPQMIEAQLQNHSAGDIWIIDTTFREHRERGQDRRVPKLGPHNENPAGEWNSYDIVCSGDTVVLTVNGRVMNIATDCELTSGWICLQSEGAPIEFRNVRLEPLGG